MTEAEKERAAIVEWLRHEAACYRDAGYPKKAEGLDAEAYAIERGDHLK